MRAYRDVNILDTPVPGRGVDQCLLLVHARRVVGEVTYVICRRCGRAVITHLMLGQPFLAGGLGIRALSHLRSLHPGVAWHHASGGRLARGLLRRMCITEAAPGATCVHMSMPPPG
ncbi:hypothetical protein [Embleya sp. NBC_00896]|uniref:hypothetical protein n=1 Tax=Embleya sp. NBC_00896 TaxID=2975961 RepID=UPI0038703156|nr:hypothetical protein OG928_42775 [Embleya sp. NBC_00896]